MHKRQDLRFVDFERIWEDNEADDTKEREMMTPV